MAAPAESERELRNHGNRVILCRISVMFFSAGPVASFNGGRSSWLTGSECLDYQDVVKSARKIVPPIQADLPLMSKRHKLPDHVKPGIRLLLVGINPGLRSAAVGHHFAGHSNRFWKLLAESKLVPVPLSYREDHRLPEFGIGLTNIIGKPSRGIDSLTTAEYRAGRKRLLAKVKRFKPRMVALLGITIHRVLFHDETGRPLRRIHPGLSTQTLGGVPMFVLPNPSGRNAHASYTDMLRSYRRLRTLVTRSLK